MSEDIKPAPKVPMLEMPINLRDSLITYAEDNLVYKHADVLIKILRSLKVQP